MLAGCPAPSYGGTQSCDTESDSMLGHPESEIVAEFYKCLATLQ